MELTHFEKTGTNEVKLTVTVNAEEFGLAVDAAIREKGKKLTVPGFRKGKAPKALLEKTYGREYFYQDAVNETYGNAYDMAVEKAEIVPVDRAEIELVSCSEEGYSFTATVTVKPEVTVKSYKGLKAEKLVKTVADSEVDAELNRLVERNARIVDVEGRPAQMGDQAEIDYEGFKDGVAFEGGKGENYSLTIGSHSFIDTFEDQLIGKNVGEEVEVNVTFPEDYHAENLKGKPAMFKVVIKEIKAKELPELDDEFAQDVSEFDTLEEYKEDVKKKLSEKRVKSAEREKEAKAVEKAVENASFDVPEAMIQYQVRQMAEEFAQRMASQGLSIEQYMQYTGMTADRLFDDMRPEAEKRVKNGLVLEAIVKAENIEVTDDDFEEELKNMASMYQMDVEKIKEMVDDAATEQIKKDVAIQKAVKLVADSAKEI